MPIYEYECSDCHHTFDLIQKISDEPITKCPACSMNTAVKLVSAAGFQLKGTGWYATDFKDKNTPEKKSTTKDVKKAPDTAKASSESSTGTKNTSESSSTSSSSESK